MTSKIFRLSTIFSILVIFILSSCSEPGDARKRPPNVKDRVKKNIEEGRGVKLFNSSQTNIGEFDFASSTLES